MHQPITTHQDLDDPRPSVPLAQAQLCLDCESVWAYDGSDRSCPKCAGLHSWPISNWIDRRLTDGKR